MATSRILARDGVYLLHKYKDETELENIVVGNASRVFGETSIYFDIKKRVSTRIKSRVTDGLLLDLADSKNPRIWIEETELADHDPYKVIEPQIRGFIRALDNEDTLAEIRNLLYRRIQDDANLRKRIGKILGRTKELYYLLDSCLHSKKGIVIVIDEIRPDLEEITTDLSKDCEVETIEFRTYKKDSSLIHVFTPFKPIETPERTYPPVHYSWEAALKAANPAVRSMFQETTSIIDREFPSGFHRPNSRRAWYFFYAKKEPSPDSLFLVVMPSRKRLHFRIHVDPRSFNDPRKLAKEYKGWFYKKGGKELGIFVSNDAELGYAMDLVRQSHANAER